MFTEREYKQLHPTGSKANAFYGNVKVHKLRKGEGLKYESRRVPILLSLLNVNFGVKS